MTLFFVPEVISAFSSAARTAYAAIISGPWKSIAGEYCAWHAAHVANQAGTWQTYPLTTDLSSRTVSNVGPMSAISDPRVAKDSPRPNGVSRIAVPVAKGGRRLQTARKTTIATSPRASAMKTRRGMGSRSRAKSWPKLALRADQQGETTRPVPGGVAIKKADIGVIDEPSRRPSKKKIERPTNVSRGQPVRQCRQELSDLGIVNDKRHVLGIRTDLARDKGEGAASRAPGDGGGMLGSSMNHAAEHDPRAEAPLTGRGGTLRAGPCLSPRAGRRDRITDAKQWRCAAGSLIAAYTKDGRPPRSKSPPLNVHPAQLVNPERALASAGRLWICQSSCEHRTGLMRTDPRVDARGAPSPVSRALCFLARRRKTAALRWKCQRAYGGANETGRSVGAHGDRNWSLISAGAEEIAS